MRGSFHFEILCLSLTAGTAIGVLTAQYSPYTTVAAGAVSLLLSAMLLRSLRHRPEFLFLAAAFMLTGFFCAVSDSLGSPFSGTGMLPAAEKFAAGTKEAINAIPYSSDKTPGLIQVLLTGDRSGIDRSTRDIFRSSGASHILALSGLHLGIIYSIILLLSRPLGNTPAANRLRYAVTVPLCGFYTLATGAGPSVTRAFLFILLGETARITHRAKRPPRIFLAALTLQLIAKPSSLAETGFQLSYLAMAGITLVFPVLDSWFPAGSHSRADIPRRIWQAAALSISCQIFTGPLAWLKFGTFPKYFLLTNILAMPVTTLVMITSVLATALSAAGICPLWAVEANEKTVSLLIWILTVISEM